VGTAGAASLATASKGEREMKSSVVAFLLVLVVQGLALAALAWLLPGLRLDSLLTAAVAVVLIAALNAVLWPVFVRLIERLNLVVFAVLSILLNGLCVAGAALLLPGLYVDGLWTAFLVAFTLTVATTVITTVFAFEELIGGHGGLGGKLMHPFVLAPAELPYDGEEIVGAEHLHRVLRGWMDHLAPGAPPAPGAAAGTPVRAPGVVDADG
jgi:uncharacterized membrane protein YvlD (DUF360 family)